MATRGRVQQQVKANGDQNTVFLSLSMCGGAASRRYTHNTLQCVGATQGESPPDTTDHLHTGQV